MPSSVSIVNHNATATNFTSTLSWSPGALTLNNEFLFFQIEWQETTLGAASCNVLFRLGTAVITTTNFAATNPTGAVLAPNAVLAANARVFIFESPPPLAPTTTFGAALDYLHPFYGAGAYFASPSLVPLGLEQQQLVHAVAWGGSALLAPAANLAVNEDMLMAATAALAPSAMFGGDARTFIFDSAERLTPAAALTAAAVQIMAAQAVLAPTAAMTARAAIGLAATACVGSCRHAGRRHPHLHL